MKITVNTVAQAQFLTNLDRVTRRLNKELEVVSRDAQNYLDAIARGECSHFTPNSSNVEELAAQRNALLELAPVMGLEEEWLDAASTGNDVFYDIA